jgi:hypothetical protein
MRLLAILSITFCVAACAQNHVLSANQDSIAIKSNANPGPTAAAHCAKYGKNTTLTGTSQTGVWTEQIYNFACTSR